MKLKIPKTVKDRLDTNKPDDLILMQVGAVATVGYLVKRGIEVWYYERKAHLAEVAKDTETPPTD